MANEVPEENVRVYNYEDFEIRPEGRGGVLLIFSYGPEESRELVYEFQINNLQRVQEYEPGANIFGEAWAIDGGFITTQPDDRGPTGRTITIQKQDEHRTVEFQFVTRRAINLFIDLLDAEADRQTALIKQQGRNVAGARMTLGNLRPPNRTPGHPNPAPELFKGQSGPMSTVLEMLTGNRARQKNLGKRLKNGRLTRTNSNERMPNLVPNRGGRRRKTRRRT